MVAPSAPFPALKTILPFWARTSIAWVAFGVGVLATIAISYILLLREELERYGVRATRLQESPERSVIIAALVLGLLTSALLFFLARHAVHRRQEMERAHLALIEQLQRSDRDLHLSQTIAGLGSYVLDIPARQWTSTPALNTIFGLSPQRDYAFDTWVSIIHPTDRDRMTRYFLEDVVGSGQRFDATYRIIRQTDGQTRWVHGLGILTFDTAGHPVTMHGTIMDITERRQLDERIQTLAFFDQLTGLPNRHMLGDRIGQACAASARSGKYAAVLFLDLDHFKPLNDAYGHDVGDLLLAEVAARLRKTVRQVDTVARFGGDEFVIVLGELSTQRADADAHVRAVAEKIMAAITVSYTLPLAGQHGPARMISHQCTASIGYVLFNGHTDTATEILRLADHAMYEAKNAGRNCVRGVEVAAA